MKNTLSQDALTKMLRDDFCGTFGLILFEIYPVEVASHGSLKLRQSRDGELVILNMRSEKTITDIKSYKSMDAAVSAFMGMIASD